ncbi:MAG TPA: DoxX family membrane protein [Pseudonocardiaceae bacterium]|nr:DoxX family membrane protein [Pseudonocardiaceae bacterium]
MIMHRLARPLLASVFVVSGIDILRNPENRVKVATPFLRSAMDKVGDSLPEGVPTDPATLVKVSAGVKLLAGLGLALGKFPRLSALVLALDLVPTTLAAHAYWEHEDPAVRGQQRVHFQKNLGLLGGLLIAVAAGGKRKPADD